MSVGGIRRLIGQETFIQLEFDDMLRERLKGKQEYRYQSPNRSQQSRMLRFP